MTGAAAIRCAAIRCADCPVRALAFCGSIPGFEHQRGVVRRLPPRALISAAGADARTVYTVRSGWAVAFRDVADGHRQVLDFALPGDMVNLELISGRGPACSVETVTSSVLCGYASGTIEDTLSRDPAAQARMIAELFGRLRSASDRIATLGSRTAAQALASMALGLHRRLDERGLVRDGRFQWPLTQKTVADFLGLTRVHVTRTLAQLRSAGLMRIQGGELVIPDLARLQAFAATA